MALKSISRRHAELGFAAAVVAAAGFFFQQAAEHPGLSGSYPQTLSILLGIFGLLMIGRTLMGRRADDNEPIFERPGRVSLGALVVVFYIAAVSYVGYLIPSFILGVALPYALGYRDLQVAVLTTLATLVFIVLVFVVALQRPIPPDLLDSFLAVLR
ncbi:Tripartite tricarboxylate transporter TctB family protein [Ensifer sp. YR511]|nr:Tripartite tricarboxylate transporter TctB family protein [Ensifer sp. YR511]